MYVRTHTIIHIKTIRCLQSRNLISGMSLCKLHVQIKYDGQIFQASYECIKGIMHVHEE